MSATRGSWQRCADCGHEMDELARDTRCTACGGLLEIVHAPPALDGEGLRQRFGEPTRASAVSGVWRFQEMVLLLLLLQQS